MIKKIKKNKKAIIIGVFLLNSILSYSFRLDNITFNQRMDTEEGGYREFYLQNTSLGKERYKVNVLNSDKNNGASYIEVYPKVITVPAQTKGTIKVFAKAPKEIKKGEYNFKLQFQPINIPTLAQAKAGRIAGTSNVAIAPVIELKGYVGDINFEKALRFEGIKILNNETGKGIIVTGKLSNDSYAGIDFGAEAYGSGDYLYGGTYVADLGAKVKNKEIKLYYPQISDKKDLKKIIFYRTPSNTREVVKIIELK